MGEEDPTTNLPLAEGSVATGCTTAILASSGLHSVGALARGNGTERHDLPIVPRGRVQLAVGPLVLGIGLVLGSWRIKEGLRRVRRDR